MSTNATTIAVVVPVALFAALNSTPSSWSRSFSYPQSFGITESPLAIEVLPKTNVAVAAGLFPVGMRGFTKDEARGYADSLQKVFKRTGRKLF